MKETEVPTRADIWERIKDEDREDWDSIVRDEWHQLPRDVQNKLVSDLDSYGPGE